MLLKSVEEIEEKVRAARLTHFRCHVIGLRSRCAMQPRTATLVEAGIPLAGDVMHIFDKRRHMTPMSRGLKIFLACLPWLPHNVHFRNQTVHDSLLPYIGQTTEN